MAAPHPAPGSRASVKITGVIQAGGKSTRMGGQPKALLELGGRRIIDRVVEVIRAGEADGVIPRVGTQLETLHACYGKSCLAPIEVRLAAGQFKIVGFFDDVRVLEIPETEVASFRAPELVFMNVNTPDELARARGLLAALERR